ncbi:MAG: AAA family ATPase [Firmicutes bacterium]|nr:AAA family ATPase [Bacillota bacterium]
MPPSKLETLTGAALISTPLPPTRMIVEGLVPQGLHILGGAPKIGKSWLCLCQRFKTGGCKLAKQAGKPKTLRSHRCTCFGVNEI